MATKTPCLEYRILAVLLKSESHDMRITHLAIAVGEEKGDRYGASERIRSVCQRIEREDGLVVCWRNGLGSPWYVRLVRHFPT